MTQLRSTFDAESLGTLEAVLDKVSLELSGGTDTSGQSRPVVTREQLAKLILQCAQDGETDPAKLRILVLKRLGRE